MFSRFFDDRVWNSFNTGVTYEEKEGVYTVEAEVPGYKRSEIHIEVENDTVVVTAENKKRGRLVKSFYLTDADPEKIKARLEDGILLVEVPKLADKLPRRIEIT